jgi:hypothetical protein
VQVALYDRLPYDDVAAYRAVADVQLATRFRPARAGVDLVLTTYTRPPLVPGADVVGLASNVRMLAGYAGPVWHLRNRWSTHDTARWTLAQIRPHLDGRPVAVIGYGRVGRLVARALRRQGCDVDVLRHTGPVGGLGRSYGVVSLHLSDAVPWLADWLRLQFGAVVVNSAWLGLLPYGPALHLYSRGCISRYVVDGGAAPPDPWVSWTSRVAWQGPRSLVLRPRRVLQVLAAASAGRLEDVADRVS